MNSPKRTDDEPAEIPLASETVASAEADAPETIDTVFERWFLRFNNNDPEAKARPTPGYVSWMHADSDIADAGLGTEAVSIVSRCACVTRHMHGAPMPLASDWLTNGEFVIDSDHFRARPRDMTDAPQNWFAIEIMADDLAVAMTPTAPARDDDDDGALGGLPMEQMEQMPSATLQEVYAEPPSAPDRKALVDLTRDDVDELRARAVTAAEHYQAEALRRNEREGLPAGSTANCPPGYRILVTPEGFVAAWYSPPRRSEAETVADAWKHHTEGK